MGLLRKTTNILRLHPGPDAWLKQSAFVPAKDGISPEELRPLLKTLLKEPSLETPEAQKVLESLRELSTKAGPFLTASEIQRCLVRFKFLNDDGEKLNRARAYELAAKLHWEHLRRQVEAIEADAKPLGPTVFTTFLEEMVECLLRSGEPRKAAEIPIVLADELLGKLLVPSLKTLDYAVLAERSIGTALDCCRSWLSELRERGAQGENGEAHEAEEEKIEGDVPDETIKDDHAVDSDLIEYLRELDAAFRRVSLDLHELMFPIDTCRLITQSDESTRIEQNRTYLQVLVGIANKAGYAPLEAMALEALSDSVRDEDEENAQGYASQASDLYRAEAEKDSSLRLTILSCKRAKAADHLQAAST